MTLRKLKSDRDIFYYFSFPSSAISVIEISKNDYFSGWYTFITLANDFFIYYFTLLELGSVYTYFLSGILPF